MIKINYYICYDVCTKYISEIHLPGSQEVQTLESTLKKLGSCALKLQQKVLQETFNKLTLQLR